MAGPGASGKIFADAQKLHQKGELLAALRLYDSILASGPTPGARVYRALCLVQLGRKVEAGNEATRAYESLSSPSLPLLTTLGTVFRHLGQLKDAELLFREALSIAPESGAVRSNLGLILMQRMKLKEAAEEFEAATSLLPEDAAPPLNRGRIAIREQDFETAGLMLEEAKRRDPGHPDVGILEYDVALSSGKHDVAFAAIVRTLERKPTLFEAWRRVGRTDPNAVENFPLEKAASELVRAKSTSAALIAAAIGILRKFLAWNSLYELERQLSEILEQGRDTAIDTSGVFLLLSCNVSQKAHRAAANSSWKSLFNRNASELRPSIHPIENRKLRIGYLSSDLRGHAVGYLVAGVMEAHEHEGFEWVAYSNHVDDGSQIRSRMRGAFDRFVNITNLTDSELAEQIREDQIDVLVDLNGMTAETRATVFAYNPAPITVTWLGMPGTLGAGDKVDYVLLDQWVAHPDNLDGFDESPVILPGSYQPNDWNRPELELAGSRTEHGLPEGAIVFASFNQTQKFSPDTVAVWEEILLQVPDGVLWVLAPKPAIEKRFVEIFEDAGIDRERIIFAPRMGHQHHLARISHADLMLDNWPYNAHTTCSDALRAGTPVLTLPGETFASRVAASILETAGLADWIASDKADYAEKAVSFARSGRAEIDHQKARVYESYWHSPMPECKGFARKLEAFYRAAAERAAAGFEPAALHVRSDGDVVESELLKN